MRNYWKNFLRGITERYLIEQGRINQDALVAYYNFGEWSTPLSLSQFADCAVASVRHDLRQPAADGARY